MKLTTPLSIAALATITSSNAATIIFEDQGFTGLTSAGTPTWTVGGGASQANEKSGDFFGSSINSTPDGSDHSALHFDSDGNTIAATGNSYAALGDGGSGTVTAANESTITTSINVVAGTTYNLFFRYASGFAATQRITATFTQGANSSTTGQLVAPENNYATGTLSFAATQTGVASLTFSDIGTTTTFENDLLLDSVVVTATPEPSSTSLLGLAGLVLILRRRR